MRNFTNCKIVMFKLQKHGSWAEISSSLNFQQKCVCFLACAT
jgi:hypothetical protein